MRTKLTLAASALTAALLASAAPALAASPTFYGPSPYVSAADSPFHPGDYGHFYLEDFEDGALNTPGLSAAGNGMCIGNTSCFVDMGFSDSVGNGGNPFVGHSLYALGQLTLTFDADVLGALPVAAGLVWTDGNNPITFQAFDNDGKLLGQLIGHDANPYITGELNEDRFFGLTYAGGIKTLIIFNPPGLEIDHIQYGLAAPISEIGGVPEPASWALMLTGFFGLGGALRQRRRLSPVRVS